MGRQGVSGFLACLSLLGPAPLTEPAAHCSAEVPVLSGLRSHPTQPANIPIPSTFLIRQLPTAVYLSYLDSVKYFQPNNIPILIPTFYCSVPLLSGLSQVLPARGRGCSRPRLRAAHDGVPRDAAGVSGAMLVLLLSRPGLRVGAATRCARGCTAATREFGWAFDSSCACLTAKLTSLYTCHCSH